jgi:hypothetical protein
MGGATVYRRTDMTFAMDYWHSLTQVIRASPHTFVPLGIRPKPFLDFQCTQS